MSTLLSQHATVLKPPLLKLKAQTRFVPLLRYSISKNTCAHFPSLLTLTRLLRFIQPTFTFRTLTLHPPPTFTHSSLLSPLPLRSCSLHLFLTSFIFTLRLIYTLYRLRAKLNLCQFAFTDRIRNATSANCYFSNNPSLRLELFFSFGRRTHSSVQFG